MTAKNQLETCRAALEANGFEAFVAEDRRQARKIFFSRILPDIPARTVAWGDSLTLQETGILQEIERRGEPEIIRSFEEGVSWRDLIERRRQALLSDLFLTGSNAVTEDGQLVNLDMVGNRTAAISFGPKKVVVFVGRNKIVGDVDRGMARIREIAAPANARRHAFDTPCARTGSCSDCRSPQRICNTWSIVGKCFPRGRIKVVLIDEDLGL